MKPFKINFNFAKKLFVVGLACILISGSAFAETSEQAESEDGLLNLITQSESPTLIESLPIVIKPVLIPAKKVTPLVIGLALGGGAAKGFAHVGVIRALEENGIKAQIVTGTSAGSLVGSLYAYGYTPDQLQQISYQLDELNLADFTFSSNGVIKGNRLQQFVDGQVKNTPLQKLSRKFTAVATDLDSGQSIGFNTGDTGIAVRASCSIPNVFMPVAMNGHRYVDGGLSAPVPVSYARKAGANFVIAVDITAKPKQGSNGFLANFDQTINILSIKLLHEQLKQADIVISPDISQLSSFGFDKKQQAIDLGYKATMAQMPLIKQKISAWQKANS
ncbi:MAG: patatin-like phospholipase family protein [Burkholderiales bacterium]|nr:patatin-like phospholipase family protein [Burkholderiales bacterium]